MRSEQCSTNFLSEVIFSRQPMSMNLNRAAGAEEHDWVNRRVACLAIELFRDLIDEGQVERLF